MLNYFTVEKDDFALSQEFEGVFFGKDVEDVNTNSWVCPIN